QPPKQQKGKKAVATKKKQLIEDKTFGLKNKNKSKSVQKYISTVQKSVNSTEQQRASDAAKSKKMASKEAKKAQEAELAALFDEALLTGVKKGGTAGKGKTPAVAVETKAKQVQETFVIEEGEKTLEDMIEEQRTKLHREGKQGTPVNQETLAKWKADRKAKKLAEERRKVQAEMKKKNKGKGLSILSGRALYDYDATLFEDDADAVDNDTMKQRNDEDDDEDGRPDGEEEKEGAAGAAAAGGAAAGVKVEEALFEGDDEDLDDLDDDEGA
ncbi:unnamed protein product, partial [Ectocarpus sp. 13 AM-2016]